MPKRVRFVHHQQQVVALLGFHRALQVQDLAVHAVDAFGHDQAAAETGAFLVQQRVQRRPSRHWDR